MFFSPNGDVIGLDDELARRIAEYINRPIKFVDVSRASFASVIEYDKVDRVISNLINNDEFKERTGFS